MPKSKTPFLISALALLFLAGWLMSSMSEEPAPSKAKKVKFPTHLRPLERKRMTKRLGALPPPPDEWTKQKPENTPLSQRDPLLRGLAAFGSNGAVVVEANALRHSELGNAAVNCFVPNERAAQIQEKFGVNLLEELDRVGVSSNGVMFSGHFENANWDSLFDGAEPETYGDNGKFFTLPAPEDNSDGESSVVGVWNNEMVVVGSTEEDLKTIFDNLDGKTEIDHFPITAGSTYGEIYGSLPASRIAKLLPPDAGHLAGLLEQAVKNVEIHADAMSDVSLAASFKGNDAALISDLSKSLGGLLALGLKSAQFQDQGHLAELLEHAKVSPSKDGSFNLELALPKQLLLDHLNSICKRK